MAWAHVCEAATCIIDTSHKVSELPLMQTRNASNGAVLQHDTVRELYPPTDRRMFFLSTFVDASRMKHSKHEAVLLYIARAMQCAGTQACWTFVWLWSSARFGNHSLEVHT